MLFTKKIGVEFHKEFDRNIIFELTTIFLAKWEIFLLSLVTHSMLSMHKLRSHQSLSLFSFTDLFKTNTTD